MTTSAPLLCGASSADALPAVPFPTLATRAAGLVHHPVKPARSIALVATVAYLLCVPSAGLADPGPGDRPDSRIVFHAYSYGAAPQICSMDPDGARITRLTFTNAYEQCPAISPDGSMVAFESTRDNIRNHLYVMNIDGGGQRRVTAVPNEEAHAAWSPDGQQLACSMVFDGAYDIAVMNLDGSNIRRLTTDPAHDMAPDWSPDGGRILFTSLRAGRYEAYVMDYDGSNQRPLLNTAGETWGARWSPDGSRIVYVSPNPTTTYTTIHVVNADTTGDTTIVDAPWDNHGPDWSPDGSRIVFMNTQNGPCEIYTMHADGTDQVRLTWDLTGSMAPTWGPVQAGISDPTTTGALSLPTLDIPNPVRGCASVQFTIRHGGDTSLELFDSAGRLVRSLVRTRLHPGTHTVSWDGRDEGGSLVPDGVYHARLANGGTSKVARLVYLR